MRPSDEFPVQVTSDDGLFKNSDLPESKSLKKAAVLVPLVRSNDEWHLLFIVRASNPNDRHSGQVAFPGGRHDSNDATLEQTALRETAEEIGVHTEHIQVIGSLPAYVTVSDYAVTPIVAIMDWPLTLTLEPAEVASTLTLPVQWLKKRENFTLRARSTQDKLTNERHPVIVYQENQGVVLWGATARITLNCLKAFADEQLRVSPPIDVSFN